MNLRINWRFLAGFALASGLLLYGYFALHRFQVNRQLGTFPVRAERYVSEGKFDRALQLLHRYLLDRPNDDEIRLRYARLHRVAHPNAGRIPSATELAIVVAHQPNRHDIRLELATLLVEDQSWADARPHLEQLVADGSSDDWLIDSLGKAYISLNQWAELERLLTPVCMETKLPPLVHYSRLAEARRRLNRAAEADAVMDQLVRDHPDIVEVYLIRANYRDLHALSGSAADYDRAREIEPSNPAVALSRSAIALKKRDAEGALKELAAALSLYPNDVRLLKRAAIAESSANRPEAAVAMLRKAAKVYPRDAEIALNLLQALVDVSDWSAAHAQLEAARKIRGMEPLEIEFVSARLTLESGDWSKAMSLLMALRPAFAAAKKPTEPLDALLARCSGLAGDVERQLGYARHAAETDDPAGRLILANVFMEAGRFDDAAGVYRQLARDPKAPAIALLSLARIIIARLTDRSIPTSDREGDFQEVERLLDRVVSINPGLYEVPILRAEILLLQDRPGEARCLLADARLNRSNVFSMWAAAAALEARLDNLPEADALLIQGENNCGDSADLRLIRLRIQFATEKDQKQLVENCGKDVGKISVSDQIKIWTSQAEGYELLNDPVGTIVALDKIINQRPNDLRSHLAKFDAAIKAEDTESANRAFEALRRLDGEHGAIVEYLAACRDVQTVRRKPSDKSPLIDARRHLTQVAIRRPAWVKAALLRAEVEELDGNADRAAEAFREAFDGGERSFMVLRRLVDYYSKRHRFAEADDLIRRMQEKGQLNSALNRDFAEIYLQAPDYYRAIDLAKKSVVDGESNNSDDYLWLARISAAAHRPVGEIEAALRKATKLANGNPEPWAALIRYFCTNGRRNAADAVITEIVESVSPELMQGILAPCYEALGDFGKAEEAYDQALLQRPNDLSLARSAVAFFVRAELWSNAEKVLKKIVEGHITAIPSEIASSRRDLAIVLATHGGSLRIKEAVKLLDKDQKGNPTTSEDVRARAIVLSKDGMCQRIAFDLLDQEFNRHRLAPADLFLYARLAWAIEQDGKVRQAMEVLLGLPGENVAYLQFWIEALLQRGEPADAQFWLARLASARPNDLKTISLEAHLLFRQKRQADAASRLRSFAVNSAIEAGQLALACEQIEDYEYAEKQYRDYGQRINTASARLALARFLGRRSRYSEALDIADAARQHLPTDLVALIAVDCLRAGQNQADSDQVRRVEQWLKNAPPPQERPWQTDWLLAELADIRADYPEAIKRYRQALQGAPAHHLIVPGLIRLLCLNGTPTDAKEAEQLATLAMKSSPSNLDELSEYRGLALLQLGRTQEAVDLLKAVQATMPSYRGGLYLTAAFLQQGNKIEAISARNAAMKRSSKNGGRHPLEKARWQAIQNALGG